MVHLANLNDLILSGTVVVRSKFRKPLPGLGAVLRGRFSGELRIKNGNIGEGFIDTLLETTAELHFTELADCACLL